MRGGASRMQCVNNDLAVGRVNQVANLAGQKLPISHLARKVAVPGVQTNILGPQYDAAGTRHRVGDSKPLATCRNEWAVLNAAVQNVGRSKESGDKCLSGVVVQFLG